MTDEAQIPEEILNSKNKHKVRCQYCNSLMLKEQHGAYVEQPFDLPLMHQKHTKDVHTIETEPQTHFWLVPDMFSFENIGFSNTVDNRKYLTCADCDMGPVGYHEMESKKCYIALRRVRHGDAKIVEITEIKEYDEKTEEEPKND